MKRGIIISFLKFYFILDFCLETFNYKSSSFFFYYGPPGAWPAFLRPTISLLAPQYQRTLLICLWSGRVFELTLRKWSLLTLSMASSSSPSSLVSYKRSGGWSSAAFKGFYDSGIFTDAKLASSMSSMGGPFINCHRIVLSAVSAPLKRKFLAQPDPEAVVYVDGVRHNVLLSIVDLVYRGSVNVRREENEDFCAAMRSLAVRLDDEIDRRVYEDSADEDFMAGSQGRKVYQRQR